MCSLSGLLVTEVGAAVEQLSAVLLAVVCPTDWDRVHISVYKLFQNKANVWLPCDTPFTNMAGIQDDDKFKEKPE